MTTESLCSIGQQQKVLKQQKTTIEGRRSTKSLRRSSKAAIEGEEEEDEENNNTNNNNSNNNNSKRKKKKKSSVIECAHTATATQKEEENHHHQGNNNNKLTTTGWPACECDIETTSSLCRNNNNNFVDEDNIGKLIDSRSIITNKERLKRFWERKMEMEFKLDEQQQRLQEARAGGYGTLRNGSNGGKRSNGQQQPQLHQATRKIVTFDENNNDNSSSNNCDAIQNISSNNGCNTITDNGDAAAGNDHDNKSQVSDEEWRSLSPNAQPTNGAIEAAVSSPLEQVSVGLVCEKLREYRATYASGQQQQQAHPNIALAAPGSSPASAAVTAADAELAKQPEATVNPLADDDQQRKTTPLIGESQIEQVPTTSVNHIKDSKDYQQQQQVAMTNGSSCLVHSDEIQLISIDPTLCHSGASIDRGHQQQQHQVISEEEETNSNSFRSFCLHGRQASDLNGRLNESDEQIISEEFSSSSSSLGPFSTSSPSAAKQPQVEHTIDDTGANPGRKPCAFNNVGSAGSDEEEDGSSSAQSGSVLTVITAPCHNGQQQQQPSTLTTSEFSSSDTVSEPTSALQAIDSNSNGEAPLVEPEAANVGNLQEEEEDAGSNIGVAFESLHFDSEIKSSKQEKVDEHMFLGPPPPPQQQQPPATKYRSMVPKFNANEVKSVCNYITAAISDATRQVESYMRNDHTPTSSADSTSEPDAERQPMVGSIQRATFVQQSDHQHHQTLPPRRKAFGLNRRQQHLAAQAEDDSTSEDEAQADDNLDSSAEVPKADLSSIFEANVRREIERFETNSMVRNRSHCGNKLMNKNGLTEWRIAEEIRLFNEREMELKRRIKGRQNGENSAMPSDPQVVTDTDPTKTSRQHHNKQEEAIVRFGKTLKLPKAASDTAGLLTNGSTGHLLSKPPIKLTASVASSANNNNNNHNGVQQSISMHKFIASGGKRFVFTSSTTGGSGTNINGSSQNCTTSLNHQLTKSMTNLSITGGGTAKNEPPKVVDYKAVDSLKCKETPNVRPGLARKVIESFLRMNNESRQTAHESQSTSAANHSSIPANRCMQQHSSNGSQQSSSSAKSSSQSSSLCSSSISSSSLAAASPASAESKIQEELREMRAREAELRSQRNQILIHKDQASQNGLDNMMNQYPADNGDDSNGNQHYADGGGTSDSKVVGQPDAGKTVERLSFSTESLYPIKQTIDSFRKLNTSSNQQSNANNNFTTVQQQHPHLDTKRRIQFTKLAKLPDEQHKAADDDDYDSRVGGQRRKISMIEKWENRLQ